MKPLLDAQSPRVHHSSCATKYIAGRSCSSSDYSFGIIKSTYQLIVVFVESHRRASSTIWILQGLYAALLVSQSKHCCLIGSYSPGKTPGDTRRHTHTLALTHSLRNRRTGHVPFHVNQDTCSITSMRAGKDAHKHIFLKYENMQHKHIHKHNTCTPRGRCACEGFKGCWINWPKHVNKKPQNDLIPRSKV